MAKHPEAGVWGSPETRFCLGEICASSTPAVCIMRGDKNQDPDG